MISHPIDTKSATFFFKHIDTFMRYKDIILANEDLYSIHIRGMSAYVAERGADKLSIGKLLCIYSNYREYNIIHRAIKTIIKRNGDTFYLVQLHASKLSGFEKTLWWSINQQKIVSDIPFYSHKICLDNFFYHENKDYQTVPPVLKKLFSILTNYIQEDSEKNSEAKKEEDKIPFLRGVWDKDNLPNEIIFKEKDPWFQLFVKRLTETFFPNAGLWFSIEISKRLKYRLGDCAFGFEEQAEIRLNFNQPKDEIDLAEIIVHEIIHAYTGCNHGEAFQIEAAQKGLIMIAKEGCTIPSRTFTQKAEAILKEIGRAPEGLFSWEDPVFIPDFYCVRNQYGNWDLSRDSAKEAGQIMLLKNETLEMLNQWEKKYFKGLSPKKNRKKIPVLRIPHQTVVSSFYKQSLFMTLLKIFISRSSPKWNAYWTQFNEELKQQEKVAS